MCTQDREAESEPEQQGLTQSVPPSRSDVGRPYAQDAGQN